MRDYPIIKVAIVFVMGILSLQYFELGILSLIIAFIVLTSLIFLSEKGNTNFYYHLLFLSLSVFIIFSAGNLIAGLNKITFDPNIITIDKVKKTTVVGEVTKIDLKQIDQLNFYLEVDSMYSNEFLIKANLNILCKINGSKKLINQVSDELMPGNKIRVSGFYHKGREKRNPGEFDYDAYLKSKDILGILNISEFASKNIIDSQTNFFPNLIYQTRVAIDDQIKKYNTPETAALLRGLLLADRGEIDYQTKTEFINAGVVHVLAVSGLHVGYIILIFIFLFGRFNLYLRSILTIAGLIGFMLITGVPPSVFRATVMAVIIILALLMNRSTNLINSISIAAIIVLVFNPNEIYNPGFQLSFSAVLAIGIILPYMNSTLEKWNIQNRFIKYVILFCSVSLSVQIGTLPFTLLYFNKFSVVALLTNLVVIPLIGLIVASGIVTLIISLILPFIAVYFAAANSLLVSLLLYIINFSGNLSFSFISINDYTLADLLIFYFLLTILLYFLPRFETYKSKLLLIILIASNIFIYSAVDDVELMPDNYLSVLMIDVGQGDSFLIKFSNGQTALIDAGNATSTFDNGERIILPLLKYLGISKVDYGIVTHIDSDHYGGFVSLVLAGIINQIYKPELDSTLSKDKRFEEFITQAGIPVYYFSEQKLEIGNTRLYFLYDDNIKDISGRSTNDRSGIFKLDYGQTSFLFTGDVEKRMEKFYSKKYNNFLDSDVLKVGHHGSKTSSSQEFLDFVTPEISLISAGYKNKFGHPVKEIIDRLKNDGSIVYRTDLQKAILLRSDGNSIDLINW